MRVPDSLVLALGPLLGAWLLRLLALTLRIRREEGAAESLWTADTPGIYIVWHGRVLVLPHLYAARHIRVLVSRSRDGELVTRFIRRFGGLTVRGSSSRGGAEALRALAELLRGGWNVLVIPDGPKGPREIVKPGVVVLARLTGAPIVPMAVGASAEWRVRSWDEFRIPKPFARCVVRFGDPIRIPRALDRAGEETARKEVEAALHALQWRTDREAAS